MSRRSEENNAHGAPRFTSGVFSFDDFESTRFDDRGIETQVVTGEHMHLLRAEFEPGATYDMHSHPHEQFSLLLSGRMRITVGDETREIGPGDGWYAAANVPHGGEILGDEKVVFVDIYSPATRWIIDILKTGRDIPARRPR